MNDMIEINTETLPTVNPKIGLPDMLVTMGDYTMDTRELDVVDLGILNTMIQNQVNHE